MKENLEREVKLGVWPGFKVPVLDGIVEGSSTRPLADRRLEATYYDTSDVRLARSGLTLRHRRGEGDAVWTLKLPDDGGVQGGLARRELSFPAVGGRGATTRTPPPEVGRLLTAWVRTSSLEPVARLRTLRRGIELHGPEGDALVEVVDDEVSILEGRRVTARFREVEAELVDDAPAWLLDEVVDRLRAGGAGPPDPTPKVMRVIGPLAEAPPELDDARPGEGSTVVEVVRAAMSRSVLQILGHDLGVRLGDDPEAVHQARVATRRLRSDLRTYGPLLEPSWSEELSRQLKGVADALGGVRDTDVLLGRLQRSVAGLDERDAGAGSELLVRLEASRDGRRALLLELLESRDYASLLERLVQAARAPSLLEAGHRPAIEVLPSLVERPWRSLRKGAEAIRGDGPDEELHEVRVRAKRCRYAAEVAALAVGKPAARFARGVAAVQEVLGDHQDAVVTEAWLRAEAADVAAPVALVAGQLVAVERAEATRARRAWPSAWKAASRSDLRDWMRNAGRAAS